MKPFEADIPLVAILRGLSPAEAPDVGAALFSAGFKMLEVPLNRPGALESIELLSTSAPAGTIVGGGTMLTGDDVQSVYAAGGRLMVSPNSNSAVIAAAAALGMLCAPGVATPTEAFNALEAGAHVLKIFPAQSVGCEGLKAFKSVIPAGVPLWPVGGITPESLAAWVQAGATGFGIGGALYTPGKSADDVYRLARQYIEAWTAARV